MLIIVSMAVLVAVGPQNGKNFGAETQVAEAILHSERSKAGLAAKTTEIPGFQVAYLEGGSGDPLVLIHGSGDDKDSWTMISNYLTDRFRVIALDLPGFGDSDKPAEGSYTAQDQAEHVKAFVHALGLRSFHLGGHSLGGKIAAIYAAKNPSEVKSLWLLAPAGVYSARPSEMQNLLSQGVRIPIFGRTLEEYDQLLHFVMNNPPQIPIPVKEALIERAAADYELHNRIYKEIYNEAFPLEEIAPELTMPTRIVWGDQDRILNPSGARILETLLPDSSVLLLKGIGHAPMIETPELVAQDFDAFVQSAVN